jgi:cellobiose transport system permease protein
MDTLTRPAPSDQAPDKPPVRSATRRRASRLLWRLDERVSPYVYIAPFFIVFGLFGVYTLGYTFYVSLNKWSLGSQVHTFVGLDNYRFLATDPFFWNSLRNTVSIWILSTVPQMLLALGLAHVLHARIRARALFRTTMIVPNLVAAAAVALIFGQLFARDYGMLNWLIGVGVDGINLIIGLFGANPIEWTNIDYQASRPASHLALATMVNWRWTGYNALIFLAAMQAIPKDLYDASELDGASTWRQFWRITVPMLRPVIIFVTLVSTINGLQIFAEPLLFSSNAGNVSGGSDRQYQTAVLFLYEQAFRQLKFGYGSAIAWSLFVVILVFSGLTYFVTRRIRSAT